MGYIQLQELVNMPEITPLENQISLHLQTNHYPPIPSSMVKPCIEAIELYNAGDWDTEVELPEGITFRGLTSAPVTIMITQHHLDAWLNDDIEE